MSDQLAAALTWVGEGYPDGVPEEDAAALLLVLRQRIGDAPAYRVALALVADGRLSAEAAVAPGPAPAPGDRRRVAARLAHGGWPLGAVATEAHDADTEAGGYLGRIVAWLREGYPYGVPEHDYQPLLALLERRLTRGEVKKVAKALRRADVSPATPDDIAAVITEVTHTEPSQDDLRRVRDRLAHRGWPVDFPDPDAG
ncbi:MAG TPA: DUF3349 domain-containing protein [Dermatophilaceae bacterium]|nr:DUF3349 domain-containing protein [Dermatophilaceae bacterium]